MIEIPKGLEVVYHPKGEALEYGQLALNVYLGCTHGCTYCYAAQAIRKTKDQFFQRPKPRPNFFANLAHDIRKLEPFAADLPPIWMSPIGDPFQPCEDEYHITRDTIRLLKQSGLSIQLLTKAAHVADETMALLDERDWFGVTLTSWSSARDLEPKAGSPKDRYRMLAQAWDRDVACWVSSEPIMAVDQIEDIVAESEIFTDHFKFGPLNYAPRGYELADAAREVRRVMALYGYAEGAMERGRRTFYLKESLRKAEVQE